MKKLILKSLAGACLALCLLGGCQSGSPAPDTAATALPATETVMEADGITVSKAYYEENGSLVAYPTVAGAQSAESVNALTLGIAASAADRYEGATVDFSVCYLDETSLSVLFTGSAGAENKAYPATVYFTANITFTDGGLVRLGDYMDVEALARTLAEGGATPAAAEQAVAEAHREYLQTLDIEGALAQADFSLQQQNLVWPASFSYITDTYLAVILPVPHAAGDWAEFRIDRTDL